MTTLPVHEDHRNLYHMWSELGCDREWVASRLQIFSGFCDGLSALSQQSQWTRLPSLSVTAVACSTKVMALLQIAHKTTGKSEG